jgi:uncharacterized OsmC-like protein
MDATELRALQAPLKRRYREDPESALTPVSASGEFASKVITVVVDGWAGTVRAGLHPATGGDGADACSGDMLLQALVACAGVTLRSVATALGVEVRSATLTATATFDARGTLGVDPDAPVGVSPIELVATVDTDAPDDRLARLAELTDRYCVVAHSLAHPPTIFVRRVTAPT